MNVLHTLFHRLAVATLLALAPAWAQSLTGRVVGPGLVPIAGIVVDAGSGSTPATSDPAGQFTIAPLQQNQTYDVEFVPPFGALWAARIVTVTITGAVNLGDVALQPGFPITGTVRNAAGAPVPGCNLNVYDQAGEKQFTPRDGTDLLGNFQIVVAGGTWDVRVVPPVGTLLVPKQFEDVVVAAAVNLGTVTLATAYLVTGAVVDQGTLLPIAQTRLKVRNALTGERIWVPNDATNLFGQFTLPLPWGIADLDVEPPAGNTHVAKQVFGVLVPGPVALGQIRLANGALLSGTVLANGNALAGADVDVLLPDGDKVFTPNDTTTAAGTFTVAVPTGVALRTRIEAPAGTNLYGTVTAPLTLAGATNLGSIPLLAGIAVAGTVTGTGGPEAGTSVKFFDAATNAEVVTTGTVTDANGQYATHVPAGTWRIEAHTREGSLLAPASQVVAISAPATVGFQLVDKLARTTLTSFGTPALPPGAQLPINVLLHSMVPGLQTILIDLAVELPSGTRIPLLLGLPLTLPQFPFQVDFVWVPIPPIPAADLGRVLDMVVTFRNAAGAVVLDEAKTPFVVQ
ncbi:MAG: hypothetical protein WAT39_09625 [Planctomycetota bacterium]